MMIDWTTMDQKQNFYMNSSDFGSFDITIQGEIKRTTTVLDTLTFQVTILCSSSLPVLSGLKENLAIYNLAEVPDDGILHLGPIYDSCEGLNVTSTIKFNIENYKKYFSFKH